MKKNNLTLIDTYNLWYDGLEVDYLSGNFDLMIQSTCNLHCKDCSILDWKGNEYPGQTMKLEDVININEKLIKLGFFQNSSDAAIYIQRLESLHQSPDRKDLAWQLGVDADVMNPDVRQIEVRNWIDHLVIPNRNN